MDDGANIDRHEVTAALDELLAAPAIARSPHLADVLRYVVSRTLDGEGSAIKAYAIAVDVLGRPASFDPQTDPIVRVQARRLRTALDQFYASGQSRSPVQIRLPLGRYVPDFVRVEPDSDTTIEPADLVGPPPRAGTTPLASLGLGLLSTLMGVILTVVLLRWILPPTVQPPQLQMPDFPAVTVQTFDSLTPDSGIDGAALSFAVTGALALFEVIRIEPQDGDYLLRGTLMRSGNDFDLTASLTGGDRLGIVWSTSQIIPGDRPPEVIVQDAATRLAGLLGSSGSPLFRDGSAWLSFQTAVPDKPTGYVCALLQMAWNSSSRFDDARRVIQCVNRLLESAPNDAQARAARAAMSLWLARREGGDVRAAAEAAEEDIARAMSLAPQSSFVQDMRSLLYRLEGKLDDAIATNMNSMQANPAHMNAVAYGGYLAWMNGKFDEGTEKANRALAGVITPPFWYYGVPTFEALRTGRYTDATQYALNLNAGDVTLASVLSLAAASLANRTDVVERFVPVVMSDKRAQATGILKQVEAYMPQVVLIDRVREGLARAGIPEAAMNGPFDATLAEGPNVAGVNTAISASR